MTQTMSGDLGALRASMSGPVFGPDDEGYDEARKVWNADIDRRPGAIARCRSVADVTAALAFAREAGLEISVRGGAHNAAGTAICDDGLMIDLSLLNEVVVDPDARRARVGGGALSKDVDAATQAHGLALPFGLGHYCYTKPTYVEDLSDEVIEVLAEQIPRKSSPMSLALLYRLDEAFSRIGENDTAFAGGRSPRYITFLVGFAPDPSLLAADRRWMRDTWEALRPHAIGSGVGYLNETVELEDSTLRRAFGLTKYDRLARVKAEYDLGNVFHHNANIKPM